jgi:hypothetical protein
MWITQLSHWQTAVEEQDRIDGGGPVKTFASFNTRMICCKHTCLAYNQFVRLTCYPRSRRGPV